MYQRILVALDGSELADHALNAAIAMAMREKARLDPVCVVDIPTLIYEAAIYQAEVSAELEAESRQVLNNARFRMHRVGVAGEGELIDLSGSDLDVADSILAYATKIDADLIVMGTHGRKGFRRFVVGSVAEKVLRNALCHVLLVPKAAAASAAPEPLVKDAPNEGAA